jgi:hypothetical protein
LCRDRDIGHFFPSAALQGATVALPEDASPLPEVEGDVRPSAGLRVGASQWRSGATTAYCG